MRVDCALLCDAVTVREGLLHILGGGITRLGRSTFPAPLNAALALRVMAHVTEAGKPHALEVLLLDEDGDAAATFDISFEVATAGRLRPGEELGAVFAVPLHTVAVPHAGAYSFELLIDGVHQSSVPFKAELAGSGPAPAEPDTP